MADSKPATPVLTVLQRIENHDKALNVLKDQIDANFQQFRGSTGTVMETMEGVIDAMGEGFVEKVQASVNKFRLKRLTERAEQEKAQVEHLVKAGVLKVSDVITEKSVIVGRVFEKDGSVQGVGRLQLEFGNLNDDLKAKFLGQGVGFLFESESKEKLEVLEVYEVQQTPVPVVTSPEVVTETAPATPIVEAPTPVVEAGTTTDVLLTPVATPSN